MLLKKASHIVPNRKSYLINKVKYPNLFGAIRAVLFLILLFCFSGCAVGPYGTVVSKVTYTDSAMVIDLYSFGFQLRPGGYDGGASLGQRHAVYIFPCSLKEERTKKEGWHWFNASLPEPAPLVRATSVYGLELETSPQRRRMALGYSDQIETLGPRAGESAIAEILYDREIPEKTRVFFKEKLDGPPINTCQ